MYCMCHKTHVEHLEIQTRQHGITPSSPIPTTKQLSNHRLIGQEDVDNHIGQKTLLSLIPSTKQLGIHRLIGQDDVVVWFAKVCFGIEAEDIPPPRHYQETLRELRPCCDHKHPLE